MGVDPHADKELTGAKAGSSMAPSRAQRLSETLNDLFAPRALQVIDESRLHAGHAGARPEGETHFRVRMTSAAFAGKTRIARQRAVMEALQGEFASGLHALALELKAPDEP
jgi:BolA protein